MNLIGIEWDEAKNELNKHQHGLGFEEAQLVFADSQRLERPDRSEGNTSGEDRIQTLGMVGKILLVVYTERGDNRRLIMARPATKTERRSYHGYYQIDGKGWTEAT